MTETDNSTPASGQHNLLTTLNERVYIIAEIGSNHSSDLQRAFELIDACAEAGANAVKFQSWHTPAIQNPTNPATGAPEPAYPILEKYELPIEWHNTLQAHCAKRNIDFLSTPFDLERARLLQELQVPAIKIASGDLTFTQLLQSIGDFGIPILLSTGMANIEDVEQALTDLGHARPLTVLLHCVGAYPPDYEDANLKAIQTLSNTFQLPVGISDHYPGYTTVVAAVALGARVVEKHVTIYRSDGTPDSPFALELDEFSDMVQQIRIIEKALGDGIKSCMPSEMAGQKGGRRSLYWSTSLEAGTLLTSEQIKIVRPSSGAFQPCDLERIIGRRLIREVQADRPVLESDFVLE